MPHSSFDELIELARGAPEQRATALRIAQRLSLRSPDEASRALDAIDQLHPTTAEPEAAAARLIQQLSEALARSAPAWSSDPSLVRHIAHLYSSLKPHGPARSPLLRALAAAHTPAALGHFARLAATDPPADPTAAALAFTPLFQQKNLDPAPLFPELLDAISHPALAAPVLDLANYLFRNGLARPHPFTSRAGQIRTILEGMIQRLNLLTESPERYASQPKELAAIISEAVGLIVPLCDAAALIGDPALLPLLRQALDLPHRRIRTEAAAAIARFDAEAGGAALAAMLREPAERLRALAYLEELNLSPLIPDELKSPEAVAEGQLAAWLSAPAQFGVPPSALELIDVRRQYWPGYSQQIDCFLFRFEYALAGRAFYGIGLAGPIAHAFQCDLEDFPPDDIYALFAGWQAEHPEIAELPADALDAEQLAGWTRAAQQLSELGYSEIELIKAANFFGQEHLVATAMHSDQRGVLIIDSGEIHWFPARATRRPLSPDEAYFLYKGRKLLRAFN